VKLRQALAGFIVLACLAAVLFALLQWRVNTPEDHLRLGPHPAEPGRSDGMRP
jgi:hypothetical protein